MDKNYDTRLTAGEASLSQVRQSVYSDLQYVSLKQGDKIYGGWYRVLPDGRMELLALANVHCERRNEGTPIEQARGMLEDFIRATQTSGLPEASSAPSNSADERRESESSTLGKLLYSDTTRPRVAEEDWIELVRLIAAGDPLALDQLFERTHRIVFTFVMRLIGNRQVAEEVTLDVYHDVWRQAAHADLSGSVVAWLMNQARLRAIERLEIEQHKNTRTGHLHGQGASLRNALATLSADERQLIEAAYFSESTYRDLAAELQQPVEDIKRRLQRGMEKLCERPTIELEPK